MFSLLYIQCSQPAKRALLARAKTALKELKSCAGASTVTLQPFSVEETREFVESALSGGRMSSRLGKVMWEMTGGLPLYAEQVCWALCISVLAVSLQDLPVLPALKYGQPDRDTTADI